MPSRGVGCGTRDDAPVGARLPSRWRHARQDVHGLAARPSGRATGAAAAVDPRRRAARRAWRSRRHHRLRRVRRPRRRSAAAGGPTRSRPRARLPLAAPPTATARLVDRSRQTMPHIYALGDIIDRHRRATPALGATADSRLLQRYFGAGASSSSARARARCSVRLLLLLLAILILLRPPPPVAPRRTRSPSSREEPRPPPHVLRRLAVPSSLRLDNLPRQDPSSPPPSVALVVVVDVSRA